jgi:hypothetical protein
MGEIDAAWLEFLRERHADALERFGQAAKLLRDCWLDITAVATVRPSLKLAIPEVAVEDVSSRSVFINWRDIVWKRQNPPERQGLYGFLRFVEEEVHRAKAGQASDKTPMEVRQ